MTEYTINFTEPIAVEKNGQKWNDQLGWHIEHWTEMLDTVTFYTASAAKKFMKAHLDKVASSSITKIYSNGDWVPCGEIQLSGRNSKKLNVNTQYNY